MKLHEDVNAFQVLINDIHEKTGFLMIMHSMRWKVSGRN